MNDLLYICGTTCTGKRPTASDPLAQHVCLLSEPHFGDMPMIPPVCYKRRVIDQDVAQNVLRHGGSKTYDQMWGHTDDPWEWDEEQYDEDSH